MSKPRFMPIGIQDFEKLRKANCFYVDKTKFVWDLVQTYSPYFLSRPRRFGKSLFLSTLEAYFLGKKDLFKGLALEQLEEQGAKEEDREAWQKYPIFRFDFNAENYSNADALNLVLDKALRGFEFVWGRDEADKTVSARFGTLLQKAHDQTGLQAVVLVDEYDKPLLETLESPELFEHNRNELKAFFCNLKKEDSHIRFAFLTGVTKFPQVSIFSDLNNLKDISMNPLFNEICGISESELLSVFDKEIEELAESNQLSKNECIKKLQKMYDGYHFYQNSEGVYNPFSLLNTFEKGIFDEYWYRTGASDYFNADIEKNHFDIKKFVEGISAKRDDFSEYQYGKSSFLPFLYQCGYLTIRNFEEKTNEYILTFPNDEIKYRFLGELCPIKLNLEYNHYYSVIVNFVKDIRAGKVDDFMTRLQSILSSVPYSVYGEKQVVTEQTFQTGVFLVFQLMGQFTQCEVHSAKGRADAVVWTKDSIYVFEFKLTGTKEEALQQIEDKSYVIQYQSDGRKIVKIGVGFEKEIPIIKDWLVE